MKRGRSVRGEFLKICGILPRYKINRCAEHMMRGNTIGDGLAEKIFDHPALLKLLLKKIPAWLKTERSDFTCSLAGYIFYIQEDYKKATLYFLESLRKNRKNLDTWFDLAFSLYHQDSSEQKLAHDILFAHRELSTRFDGQAITLKRISLFVKKRNQARHKNPKNA